MNRNIWPYIVSVIYFFINIEVVSAQYHLKLLQKEEITNYYELEEEVENYYRNKDKGKGSGYKHWKKWSLEHESYYYPSGEMFNKNEHIDKTFKNYQKDNLTTPLKTTNGYWINEGPLSYVFNGTSTGGNGRINVMAEDPSNPNILYVGAPKGGLFKSTNSGISWTCLTNGMPIVGVSGIAVDHTNGDNIFILTGDGNGFGQGIGVLKSEDGGQSWIRNGFLLNDDGVTFELKMHPSDPDILFATTSRGIYRTTNGGVNWFRVQTGYMYDIAFRPNNPTTVYASGKNGFYLSTNGGISFNLVLDPNFPTNNYTRTAIAVSPENNNYVYIIFGGSPGAVFDGVYLSTDAGLTFQLRSDNSAGNNFILGDNCLKTNERNQVDWDLTIEADPDNATVLYVGGIISFKSTDGGLTWNCMTEAYEPSSIGYIHADIHNFIAYDERLYACTDGGIYKSTNGGNDFENLSDDLDITEISDIDVHNGQALFGAWDIGTGLMDLNITTQEHLFGGDGFEAMIDYDNPNYIYISTQLGRARSADGGSTFQDIHPSTATPNWGFPFEMDPNFPQELWIGHENGKLFRTLQGRTVGQNNWLDVINPMPANENIIAISKSYSDPNTIYAISKNTIIKSTNAAASTPSFQIINSPPTIGEMSDIAVDYNQPSHIYVSIQSIGSNIPKMFVSYNSGTSWNDYSDGLPDIPVKVIEVAPGIDDEVYIGTDIGVFYRKYNMSEWTYFSNGLPISYVWDLKISGSKIYASTFGRGLWSSSLYTSCPSAYNLTPSNDPSASNYTGPQTYHASDHIISTRIITGGIGTDVKYFTENYIELKEGFIAKESNRFVATLKDCPE